MNENFLNPEEYNPYYKQYIDKTSDLDIVNGLKQNLISVTEFFESIPQEKHLYAYAENKWSILDILLHIIDTERIFSYRALRIIRKDKTPMVGFDQDEFVISGNANNRSMESLIEEYKSVRKSTITLYSNLRSESLKLIGEASGSNISARAIGYIITGHENHHISIIRERYL
ncbi:DinB family protein [Winogradskyella vincentii]|uniref:DinB family protein n=1 Tax=Winogradskyella vincentii TaxID=2877122 RepID=A0ABS7XZA5_9FLAO|nr:DinB family protein [Winogradskyella vincentii]MCA0152981.1 DinB family protein [Winogradskyella vincentii]